MKRGFSFSPIAAAVAAVLITGCASSRDVKRLDRELDQVRTVANAAMIEAREAKVAADAARANSERTEEMVNRSFQRSMRK